MASRTRVGLLVVAVALLGITSTGTARQRGPAPGRPLPDFDVRDSRPSAAPEAPAGGVERRMSRAGRRQMRMHPHTRGVRVLDDPGLSVPPRGSAAAVRAGLSAIGRQLELDGSDITALDLVRDYVSASTGLRHLAFVQSFDGVPVFDGAVTVHVKADGTVARVTSSAARGAGRSFQDTTTAAGAASAAAAHVRPGQFFAATRRSSDGGPRRRERFARGPFLRDVDAALVWLPVDGRLRLAWQVDITPDGEPQAYDVIVDAADGSVLVRRNRVLSIEGSGRVIQSDATRALDPRRPDAMPAGADGCPPPTNHQFISLTAPFRDPSTVLLDTGRLEGNNVHVFHLNGGNEAPAGTPDGTGGWSFDHPFNSAGSAATTLFYAVNFAHDFFYELGFDEAAGNFQHENFGRGGLGNDSVTAVARATGRNNATYEHAPDGSSPTISMYLWDGAGCWSQDVDADGASDIDGDYDLDIVLHEFHHGVSHRLNTSFNGNEAGAIGEGAGDFFAYSVNGDTTLAEYARPGGLRTVNAKTYGDWYCYFGIICEVHDNGEIFANVLWDVRERFRADDVRGSDAAAVHESHQLYVDALKLSPPAPTMLDIRDAMLLADSLRNAGSPGSQNFCRIWESFAGRGMGLQARDTHDNGFNQVTADFSVPDGCVGPPPLPAVSVTVTVATASEAGTTNGTFTLVRETAEDSPLTVTFTLAGNAGNGTDYVSIPGSATIPGGAASVDVHVTPIDDPLQESDETVILTVQKGPGYAVGSPSSGTVTIVSEDVAPDFAVTAFTAPQTGGAGFTVEVSDTTANQGSRASDPSSTSFYLSTDYFLKDDDTLLGSRTVPGLASGESSTASTALTLPETVTPGTYRLFAKADGPGQVPEPNEVNNLRSLSIRIGPDLAVSAFTAPATAGAGGALVVTDTTKNQGAGTAASSQTWIYLSTNTVLDASDTFLQSRPVGSLAPGDTHIASTTVDIPSGTPSGTYYLLAAADGEQDVAEAVENNNTRFATIRIGPDLTISALSAPSRAASAGTIAVTDTTRNAGAGAAVASTTAFYLSSNTTLDGADERLTAERAVGALAGSGSSTASTNVTLPVVTPGTWYLLARADDHSIVAETLETNNTRYAAIGIGPDLDVTAFTAPFSAVAGATIVVNDTVRNVGTDPVGASITRIYLSLNLTLDASDMPIGERSVVALAPGASHSGPTTVTIPEGLSGRYYLIAAADGPGTVPESSESNNTGWRALTVNPQ
jgi:subtilase family serine protease